MSWKKVNMKKILIVFCSIAVVGIGYYLLLNNEDGKEREIKIIAEYQAIKQPEGANTVYYELKRKFVMRWIVAKYTGQISDNELEKYYDQELTNNGWRKNRSHPGTNNVYYYYYKKDNLELELGLRGTNSWSLTMDYVDAKY